MNTVARAGAGGSASGPGAAPDAARPVPGAPDALHAHAERMDRMYRLQRYVYNATRKYYLLGRDTMLAGVAPGPGQIVLEIGCGTGRNLIWLAKRHPQARFFGVDASAAMLDTARAAVARHGVADRVTLSTAMAETVDLRTLPAFAATVTPHRSAATGVSEARDGLAVVDRVIFSYALSMIVDWRAALDRACSLLAPGGSLHIVDFWDLADHPAWARRGLARWLAAFGVHHRPDVIDGLRERAAAAGAQVEIRSVLGRYAWIAQARTRPVQAVASGP